MISAHPTILDFGFILGREWKSMRYAVLAALVLTACDRPAPEWKGWVYPNAAFLPDDVPLGSFATLEECRASARSAVMHFEERLVDGEVVKADYECGFGCRADGGLGGLNVCERTVK